MFKHLMLKRFQTKIKGGPANLFQLRSCLNLLMFKRASPFPAGLFRLLRGLRVASESCERQSCTARISPSLTQACCCRNSEGSEAAAATGAKGESSESRKIDLSVSVQLVGGLVLGQKGVDPLGPVLLDAFVGRWF